MNRSFRTSPGLVSGLILLALPFAACSGKNGAVGPAGPAGPLGTYTATVSGTAKNSANGGAPVVGATISFSPTVEGTPVTTDEAGAFTVALPAGVYTVSCEAADFAPCSQQLSVLAGIPGSMEISMVPTHLVRIDVAGVPATATPGMVCNLSVTVTTMNGSTVQSYHWAQVGTPTATITGGTTAQPTITLAPAAVYKQQLLDHLNVQERWAVLGVDPHAAELAAVTVFEVTVTTTSGSYTEEVEIHADLDFLAWSPGLRNVPLGLPVLLGGRSQASYAWALTKPAGSTAALQDATTRFPWFVPDVEGNYTLSVTDLASGPFTLALRAAAWRGGIVGIDGSGRPVTDCRGNCHSVPIFFPEKFVQWAGSGHAEIFKNNINTGGHYSASCFACHTVGFNERAANGGFDDSPGYAAFMAAMFPNGQSHPNSGNWSGAIANYPAQARLANIQCENCHGPNGQNHYNASISSKRETTAAELCATCHGEPLRHARFQQWQESGHGNFETAIGRANNGDCVICHTAQGFLDWYRNGLSPTYSSTPVSVNEVQPITCVVCHDPHNVGTTSGTSTNAPMRVEGDSPPLMAGYTAYGLGKGAMCIVCHNSRRGDPESVLAATPDRAPHVGTQGDVLMGENMLFVSGGRGSHSLIQDSCVTCHIELSPPPAELSYNLGGTNHSFAADTAVCGECHGAFGAEALMALTESRLEALGEQIAAAIEDEITFHTTNGRAVRITGDVNGTSTTVDITSTSVFHVVEVADSHGRAAMTVDVDGIEYEHVQANAGTSIIHNGAASGRLLANGFSSDEQILSQALWNLNLLHSDASSGVHNPRLVTEVIAATAARLAALWP